MYNSDLNKVEQSHIIWERCTNSAFVLSLISFNIAFANIGRTIVHSMIIILLADGDITVISNTLLRLKMEHRLYWIEKSVLHAP